jgi:protein phosphatase
LVRKTNQDAILLREDLCLFAVADGMGGHQAGEVAAATALYTLEREVESATVSPERYSLLREAVQAAHKSVLEKAGEERLPGGMGTTLSALLFGETKVCFAHVGDSRIYRLRADVWSQMTLDHSWIAEQVRAGFLTEAQAAASPHRNLLTRALGTQRHVEIEFFEEDFFPGETYLLCSDGLWGALPEERICAAVTRFARNPPGACKELVGMALEAGGKDNIGVVVVAVL